MEEREEWKREAGKGEKKERGREEEGERRAENRPWNLPGGRDLVLYFDGAEAPVDLVQERDAAPAGTSSVDLREDDVLRAGQVGQPVDLELVRHQLAVRAAVPGTETAPLLCR